MNLTGSYAQLECSCTLCLGAKILLVSCGNIFIELKKKNNNNNNNNNNNYNINNNKGFITVYPWNDSSPE